MNRTGKNGPKTDRLREYLATRPIHSRLPQQPEIPETYLNRRGVVWLKGDDGELHAHYEGDLHVGQVFAWEPDIPTARMLVIICAITGPGEDEVINHDRGVAIISGGHETRIWTLALDSPMRRCPERWRAAMQHAGGTYVSGAPVWNDESRFREAVTPTLFSDQLP